MIPKIIHYCWLGNNPKSEIIKKCIASWKKVMPDYEIKEWNETNFDVSAHKFMSQAYQAGKYAFASDQLRYIVLKEYGGLFLDCDVEVLKPFDVFLNEEVFLGIQEQIGNKFQVNPGLVIGCVPNNSLIGKMVDIYENTDFLNEENVPNIALTSPYMITTELKKFGYQNANKEQLLDGNIHIYPTSYFDPMEETSFRVHLKENWEEAYAIHWGAGSWLDNSAKSRRILSIILRKIFGNRIIDFIRNK